VPPMASARSFSPDQTGAAVGIGAAAAVVADRDPKQLLMYLDGEMHAPEPPFDDERRTDRRAPSQLANRVHN
jgi:hypothetical protein